MNQFKTVLLLASLTAILLVVGDLLWGRSGLITAFIIALVMNVGSYWFSDKLVLKMYRAQEVDDSTHPEFVGIVRQLAAQAQLPMPKVYIVPTPQPNAFATGRDPEHAAVAATEGILRMLNRDELAGVMAHELSHVKNRDTLISTIAATIASTIGYLAILARYAMLFGGGHRDDREGDGGGIAVLIMAVLMPVIAAIIQSAISRSREYMADEGGAAISGKPLALASALLKLERGAEVMPMETNPATAHMFIVNPLTAGGLMALFRTHPATEDRVARLQAMASAM